MKTKIICTLGPATKSFNTIKKLQKNGMILARINTAHGNIKQYEEFIKHTKKLGVPVILDLKGPDLRVKLDKPLNIQKKEKVKFYKNKTPCFNYDIIKSLNVKDKVFFDNGLIKSKIVKKTTNYIELEFQEKATIQENKGVNIPSKKLKVPNLSKKDLENIKFAKKHKIEFLALSFVRNKKDVQRLKAKYKEALILSKIENKEGLQNIKEIMSVSDGIIIARGDLAVEIGKEHVPYKQKEIINLCNEEGTPCIVATQMLESMTSSKEPTRAEVSDVANAVIDGTDGVMLSGETAIGKYPLATVIEMNKILNEANNHVEPREYKEKNDSESLISAATTLLKKLKITKAICLTKSGYTARMVSRHKINKKIIAITRTEKTHAALKLSWGVEPTILNKNQTDSAKRLLTELKKKKILTDKDKILLLRNKKEAQNKITNAIELYDVKDI
jgi:pyruvate kinase